MGWRDSGAESYGSRYPFSKSKLPVSKSGAGEKLMCHVHVLEG